MAQQARGGRGALSAGAPRARDDPPRLPAEGDAPLRPLRDLPRLPRQLALRRLAYGLGGRLAAAPALDWIAGATQTRAPRALVPDTWPGLAAIGQEIVQERFPLLGRTLPAPTPPFRPLGADQRWIAALNGFGWLRHLRAFGGDQGRRAARELVALWIERETRWTATVWDPAVTGERIAAWLGHWEFFAVSAEVMFRQRLLASLRRQARYLSRVLPAGLAGGELVAALKGLAIAGAAFEEGGPWLEQAQQLVVRELPRQVLADGGHVERSPSRQLAVLRDLIDLKAAIHAADLTPPPALADAIEQMAPMLRLLQHGDGALALFNGGEESEALMVDLVLQRASGRLRPIMSAPQSGFQRLQAGRLVAIVDCGRPPPPGLDAGAHAGALSFEVSVGRERLIVNCGAHPGDAAWRRVQRATAAHSTLTLDDHNLAELLPRGGLGQRPDGVTCRRDEGEGSVWLDMSHDGYRPRYGVQHHRRLYLERSGEDLRGEERLQGGRGGLPFSLRFHLHPAVQASLAQSGAAALLRLPKGGGWWLRARGALLKLEPSIYLGRGGEVRRSLQLVLFGTSLPGETLVRWALQRDHGRAPAKRAEPAAKGAAKRAAPSGSQPRGRTRRRGVNGPLGLLLLAPVLALLVALATAPLRALLLRRAVLDRPNERSSHRVPTPRGAGLALIPLLLLAWALLARRWALPGEEAWVLAAALGLMLLSFLDDLRGLGPALRLLLHLAAVILGLGALPADFALSGGWLPQWADLLLAGLAWLWLTELTNFMDGIDGITGVEVGAAALGLALVAALGLAPPELGLHALLLFGALLGFLAWNWPPAAIFLGDSGSVPLGYLLGWLLLQACHAGLWPLALILPLYYWADATWTLLARARRGEKVWQAHRSHFYQRAAGQGPHGPVLLAVLLADLVLLALGLWALSPAGRWPALGGALLTVLALLAWLSARARR